MKKIILCLVICAIFLGFSAPSYAALTQMQKDAIKAKKESAKAEKLAKKAEKKRIKELRKTYKKVSSDMQIIDAMELMKKSPAIGSYEMIMGDNYKGEPIRVGFENLGEIRKKYTNFDAINKQKRGKLYIYVDKRHQAAPPEAIAALVSGMPVHLGDKKDSVNEEAYAWSVEAVVWSYLLKKNPDVVKQRSRLVNREEILREQYEKSPRNAQYVVETVRKKRGDIRYKWESAGYSHKEFDAKVKRLYGIYNNSVVALDLQNKELKPVSNVKGAASAAGLTLAPKIKDETTKAPEGNVQKTEIKDEAAIAREKYEHYVSSPVPASSCKAPCSAQGSATCPGSCPSFCPNKKGAASGTLEDKKDKTVSDNEITCPYCKVSSEEMNDQNADKKQNKKKRKK